MSRFNELTKSGMQGEFTDTKQVAKIIAELEADIAEKTEWNIELDTLNVKLQAQIERLGDFQYLAALKEQSNG